MKPTDGHSTTGEYTPSLHGTSGPIALSLTNVVTSLYTKAIKLTTEGLGVSYNQDINSGTPLGLGE